MMKYNIALMLFKLFSISAFCQNSNSGDLYTVPDSIKAIGLYAELKINDSSNLKKDHPGIGANKAELHFGYDGKEKVIKFLMFALKDEKATGLDVYPHLTGHAWKFDWKPGESYPLLIATASDSATNSTLYSGYVFLKAEKKWKLIATQKVNDTVSIKYIWPADSYHQNNTASISNRWLQRSNGSWKALDAQMTRPPSLRQMSNIDSLALQKKEEAQLRAKLPKDSVHNEEGIFYQTIKEGSGRLVQVSDTITVHYKGSLFSDGSIFDQTKEKPATFPLERLIYGWQLGLVHCKIGGKIRLFITSGSAYGIRTRSATIPPNSILVFDVEVLDAKEKIRK
jgi:FKBP-type peptidyl-prolyl cis-trans isomerase FkpA